MSDVSIGDYPGKCQISFFPILDMNPSHFTCIYSVLLFVIDQAKVLDIDTPVITFHQPLWLNATEVVQAKSLPIVLILGGFSYVGELSW